MFCSQVSMYVVVYLVSWLCDMCIKSNTAQTNYSITILLIPTCNLSLLLSAITSSPSWILVNLPPRSHHLLVYTSVPSPDFTGNTTLTCKSLLVDILPSCLRQIPSIPSTSSHPGKLRMLLRSSRPSRTSPTSLL
jgi:hypothetical protein